MKKLILFVGSLSLLFIGCFLSITVYPKNTPTMKTVKGSILIDRLTDERFYLKLFYSNLMASQVEAYAVENDSIELLETPYSSFTEGFIETEKNTLLLKAINKYRETKGLEPITYYYNYQEIDDYGFVSLGEDLSTLYIINLFNYQVKCPSFDSPYALENQYIYHIALGDEGYYVLTAEANGYKAYLYTLDQEDFHMLSARKLSPPAKALTRHQYALDSSGNAYFIGNYSLIIISDEETINLPLSFNPDSIYCIEDKIYALSTSELFLSYAVLEDEIGLTQTGQVNLPNKFVKLISCHIQDSILYTVAYDENHPLYRHYITLYSLNNNNILYCLALKSPLSDPIALLGVHYES